MDNNNNNKADMEFSILKTGLIIIISLIITYLMYSGLISYYLSGGKILNFLMAIPGLVFMFYGISSFIEDRIKN